MKIFLAIVGGLVLLAVVIIGGWQLGWWMQSYAVNKNAHIYQNGYGAQSAWVNQVDNLISQMNEPGTPSAEKAALVTQACNLAAQINQPPSNITVFVSQNCPSS